MVKKEKSVSCAGSKMTLGRSTAVALKFRNGIYNPHLQPLLMVKTKNVGR
jgi:hypothetical protein